MGLPPEYVRLYERWPTPDHMLGDVRRGGSAEFTTSRRCALSWAVTIAAGRATLNARARPTPCLAALLVTSWWSTSGRETPRRPADPVAAMTAALRDVLAETGAEESVGIRVDAQAEDCVDVTFCLEDVPVPEGLTWPAFEGLLAPLTTLDAAALPRSSVDEDDTFAALALRRAGMLVFRCERCGGVVSDRTPGWPRGVWVDTAVDSGATCGSRASRNRTVAVLPTPHVGRLLVLDV